MDNTIHIFLARSYVIFRRVKEKWSNVWHGCSNAGYKWGSTSLLSEFSSFFVCFYEYNYSLVQKPKRVEFKCMTSMDFQGHKMLQRFNMPIKVRHAFFQNIFQIVRTNIYCTDSSIPCFFHSSSSLFSVHLNEFSFGYTLSHIFHKYDMIIQQKP